MVAVGQRGDECPVQQVATDEPEPREHEERGELVGVREHLDEPGDERMPPVPGTGDAGVDAELEAAELLASSEPARWYIAPSAALVKR